MYMYVGPVYRGHSHKQPIMKEKVYTMSRAHKGTSARVSALVPLCALDNVYRGALTQLVLVILLNEHRDNRF